MLLHRLQGAANIYCHIFFLEAPIAWEVRRRYTISPPEKSNKALLAHHLEALTSRRVSVEPPGGLDLRGDVVETQVN